MTVLVATVAGLLAFAPVASAATPAPGWTIDSFATPTNFSSTHDPECTSTFGFNGCDTYLVTAKNTGSVETDGSEVTLRDRLPAGLQVNEVRFYWSALEGNNLAPFFCETQLPEVICRLPSRFGIRVGPDQTLEIRILVTTEASAPAALSNGATVSGGGTRGASVEKQNASSPSLAAFGPSNFSFYIAGLDGQPDTQAADHPYEVTTTIGVNNGLRVNGPEGAPALTSTEDPKDVVVNLPLGLVGSTLAAPECTLAKLSSVTCPTETIVGHIRTQPASFSEVNSPIYNLVPERGVPAEFGFTDVTGGSHVFYVHVVPTAKGYVLQTVSPDLPVFDFDHVVVTFYGDPATRDGISSAQVPFFTMPSNCAGEPELTATMWMDSWQHPARMNGDGTPVNLEEPEWVKAESKSPPVTGCNALSFTPKVAAQPTTHESDKPSGLEMDIKVPQTETVGVPGTPTLKKAVVTFPLGFTVDPAAGDGLAACSEAQIGYVGPSHLNFTPAPPECPEASKIGTLELETPLIPHKLEGVMYLAAQSANPFGSLIGLYVVVDDPITGVLAKIPGKATLDAHTGQLTAEFDENPNLPFSDLKLHFFGGPRAEFATPEACGTFTTTNELTPYSAPDSGPAATPSDNFLIDELCPGGFSPSFTAGSTNLQAGAFTPFVASFGRSDSDQELAGLTVTLPPGLLGKIAGVPLCSDADANAGTCPEASQVGTVKAGAGPGPNPLFVPGRAYLTGPYNGGAYGLAVVVPAVAGPFNFGTAVVRQSLRIDPRTAQVTDVSDPFPKIIDGIPLRLRRIDVALDRPGFTFNPTNCSKLGLTGAISGSPLEAPTSLTGTIGYATEPGTVSQFTMPFQVTNCASLAFKPDFEVSVSGKNSKQAGAALTARVSYPNVPFGSEANIALAKVELPKQLPSRLKTLQKACLAAVFEADPAGCPAQSIVGHAVVHTPVLPTPLQGPAYFVSHGGEDFPNLTIVLHGDGVTVQLVGSTFISKAGITSTTFKTAPDVPFSTFELTLPQGPYSALTATTNLCTLTTLKTVTKHVTIRSHGHARRVARKLKRRVSTSLVMPTDFKAQNGAELHQNTKIAVTGCVKGQVKKTNPAVRRRLRNKKNG